MFTMGAKCKPIILIVNMNVILLLTVLLGFNIMSNTRVFMLLKVHFVHHTFYSVICLVLVFCSCFVWMISLLAWNSFFTAKSQIELCCLIYAGWMEETDNTK